MNDVSWRGAFRRVAGWDIASLTPRTLSDAIPEAWRQLYFSFAHHQFDAAF
jgi:hypothetical protein